MHLYYPTFYQFSNTLLLTVNRSVTSGFVRTYFFHLVFVFSLHGDPEVQRATLDETQHQNEKLTFDGTRQETHKIILFLKT